MQNKKKRDFLKLPEFPGGKKDFKTYIQENLKYPDKAFKNRTEGVVFLHAEIDDNGKVGRVTIEKGIGDGCDEEAIRLIKGLKFGKVKNRGVRVKTGKRFKIRFKLPKPEIKFNLVKKTKTN